MTKKQWEKNPLKVGERVKYYIYNSEFTGVVMQVNKNGVEISVKNATVTQPVNFRCVNRLKKKVRREFWIANEMHVFKNEAEARAYVELGYTTTIIKVREVGEK
jgi:hypothetical protein